MKSERSARSTGNLHRDSPPASGTVLSPERLAILFEFFPVGRRVSCGPVQQDPVNGELLLAGYLVDGHAVHTDGASAIEGRQGIFAAARSVQLLLADASRQERGRRFPSSFAEGDILLLVSGVGSPGATRLQARYVRNSIAESGPFVGVPLLVLTPDLASMVVGEQRRRARIRTELPVVLTVSGGGASGPCVICDLSEEALRLRVRDRGRPLPPMAVGASVTLEIGPADDGRNYLLRGRVQRRASDACVVHIEGMIEAGRLRPFGALDLLELRTGCL